MNCQARLRAIARAHARPGRECCTRGKARALQVRARWRHRQVAAVEPLLRRIAAERLILLSSGGSDWIGGSGSARRVEGGYRVTARKVFTRAGG